MSDIFKHFSKEQLDYMDLMLNSMTELPQVDETIESSVGGEAKALTFSQVLGSGYFWLCIFILTLVYIGITYTLYKRKQPEPKIKMFDSKHHQDELLSDQKEPDPFIFKDSLFVRDNRTAHEYELPITDGSINATDLGKIKSPTGAVTRSFDPAYMNTVNCISRVSFINGEKGILEYRGYPIEQLAEKSNYLETAYLVIYGELPTQE